MQTVKSRGLDTPTLVSSARRSKRIVAMVANKPAHQGEREAADKPTAQGMPDDRLNLWYLPPAFFSQAGHGLRPAPGIPCALFGRGGPNEPEQLGRSGRGIAKSRRSVREI
ncbi:hypothetical protein [Bradyrhizobium sp. USDA 4353]